VSGGSSAASAGVAVTVPNRGVLTDEKWSPVMLSITGRGKHTDGVCGAAAYRGGREQCRRRPTPPLPRLLHRKIFERSNDRHPIGGVQAIRVNAGAFDFYC